MRSRFELVVGVLMTAEALALITLLEVMPPRWGLFGEEMPFHVLGTVAGAIAAVGLLALVLGVSSRARPKWQDAEANHETRFRRNRRHWLAPPLAGAPLLLFLLNAVLERAGGSAESIGEMAEGLGVLFALLSIPVLSIGVIWALVSGADRRRTLLPWAVALFVSAGPLAVTWLLFEYGTRS